MVNGKGDSPRNNKSKSFRDNYGSINWGENMNKMDTERRHRRYQTYEGQYYEQNEVGDWVESTAQNIYDELYLEGIDPEEINKIMELIPRSRGKPMCHEIIRKTK